MATHHVMVHRDCCSFRVTPGHLLARAGDTIVFHTNATYMSIFVPPGTPIAKAGTSGGRGWTVIEVEGGASATVTVVDRAAPDRYPYSVYCADESRAQRDFAKGGSDPEIIIYE